MKIQVSGLSQGVHRYTFAVPARDIGLDDRFGGDIGVDVTLEKGVSQIGLEATIRTDGDFVCDRCVAAFSMPLSPSYRMVYIWDGQGEEGLDRTEVQVVSPDLNVIDLSEDVRQTVLLAIPFKLLCREECRGLCPRCGANLNDRTCGCAEAPDVSQWDGLKKLMKN